tara:strand:- start:586 stop:1017 length:432 start_codon:yes stop_codon:yes gene_type:complete
MEIDMNITSWSNDDLEALCVSKNHKITFDGHEFWWYHKINGNKWELHYINGFEDWKKPYSWLKFNLHKWNKELEDRKQKDYAFYLKDMQEELISVKKMADISKDESIKTKDKIKMIKQLDPDMSVIAIANILRISRQAVHRHL